MKQKRISDKELIEEVKQEPCLVCNKTPVDVHHITTRGAGGGDVADNLAPLCRKHHSELHQIGVGKFCWKYPRVREWLTSHNRFDIIDKIHHKLNKKEGT